MNCSSLAADQFQPALGKGVNFSETKTYAVCIQGIDTYTETANPALTRLYNERRIQNREELNRALDINASVSAKGLWGSASGSASYFSQSKISSSAFYWLVDAKYELSTSMIRTNAPGFELTARAKTILTRFGIEKFYQACGSNFYSGKKVGARYSLLYEFNSSNDHSLENIAADASYGGFGVQAKASFKQYAERAAKSSQLNIFSYIVGGENSIKDYAKDPEELEGQLSQLKNQLYHSEKGVVLKWYIESYDQFTEVIEAKERAKGELFLDTFRNNALARFYDLYTLNLMSIDEWQRKLERSQEEEPLFFFFSAKIAQIRALLKSLEQQNQAITERAIDCIYQDRRDNCKVEDIQPLEQLVIVPDRDFSGFGTWEFEPLIIRDSDSNFPTFDLVAIPDVDMPPRFFTSSHRLYSDLDGSAYVIAKNPNGKTGEIKLGSLNPIIDPKTGRRRPAMCIGDYQKTCNLRIIENHSVITSNGQPTTIVKLTLFDDRGFIFREFRFFPRR